MLKTLQINGVYHCDIFDSDNCLGQAASDHLELECVKDVYALSLIPANRLLSAGHFYLFFVKLYHCYSVEFYKVWEGS